MAASKAVVAGLVCDLPGVIRPRSVMHMRHDMHKVQVNVVLGDEV